MYSVWRLTIIYYSYTHTHTTITKTTTPLKNDQKIDLPEPIWLVLIQWIDNNVHVAVVLPVGLLPSDQSHAMTVAQNLINVIEGKYLCSLSFRIIRVCISSVHFERVFLSASESDTMKKHSRASRSNYTYSRPLIDTIIIRVTEQTFNLNNFKFG